MPPIFAAPRGTNVQLAITLLTNLHRLLYLRVRSLPLGVPHLSKCLQVMIKNFKIMRKILRSGSPTSRLHEIQQLEVIVLDKEVAAERAEMAGAQLKELKEELSGVRTTQAGTHGHETRHKKWLKNIVTRFKRHYPGSIGRLVVLSALAVVSTAPGLVEKFFVASSQPELYHYDKDVYSKSARKGRKSLYFTKSGTAGDTWVPLIEKAYVKLHGNYSHLLGGRECDAIEDLTGGVSTVLQRKDILEPERFWDEGLSRANKDRLLHSTTSTAQEVVSQELKSIVGWFKGMDTRLVGSSTKIRTYVWDHGQFVMERRASWTMDFTLVKEGQKEPITELGHSDFYLHSVHLEVDLEAGNYIVYVCLDQTLDRNENFTAVDEWQLRKLSRILTERAKSQAIASTSLETLIRRDFNEYKKKKACKESTTTKTEGKTEDGIVTTSTTTTTSTKVETVVVNKTAATATTRYQSVVQSHQLHQMQTLIPLLIALASVKGMYVRVCNNGNYGDSTAVETEKEEEKGQVTIPHDDLNSVYVGLRVYTYKDVPAVVVGHLKAVVEVKTSTPPERWTKDLWLALIYLLTGYGY
ncbi:hypothetical protein BYT27DRAFT_7241740 [Phlegmacium glaucopus]|nr:hypothetical protein BYT27DRAFT_7241740 [Phlegmacium glaucopus]